MFCVDVCWKLVCDQLGVLAVDLFTKKAQNTQTTFSRRRQFEGTGEPAVQTCTQSSSLCKKIIPCTPYEQASQTICGR